MQRPNVLLLYTDQQRWDTIAAGGNALMKTPNLDRLAAEGALFDRAFCPSPVCMPSRMSLLSGQYPAALRIATNGVEMPPPEEVPCLHNILGRYDYATANIGKLHFRNHASPCRDHRDPHPAYGFDTLILSDEPGCYDDAYLKWVAEQDPAAVEDCRCDTPPAWTGRPVQHHPRAVTTPYAFAGPEELTHTAFVAAETGDWIRRHRDRPFFCIAGFYAPHCPINPPERFLAMYDENAMPLPVRAEGENHDGTSDAEWRRIKAHYYALCSHIDDQVGRILQTLDECGLAEKTLVIFTSDHGEHLGDHGRVTKGSHQDSCTRVPLILRYPDGFAPQPIRNEIVEGVDLAPTILDWCGVQTPPWMPGRSLRPLLTDGDYLPRSSAFFEIRQPYRQAWKAVRGDRFLYAHTGDGREELYDLAADPNQTLDVAGDPAAAELLQAARLEMLRRWFEVESQEPRRTGQY